MPQLLSRSFYMLSDVRVVISRKFVNFEPLHCQLTPTQSMIPAVIFLVHKNVNPAFVWLRVMPTQYATITISNPIYMLNRSPVRVNVYYCFGPTAFRFQRLHGLQRSGA